MTDHQHGNPTPTATITELPEQECYELLHTTTVGRVAFVDAGGQQLLPVNFALIDGTVYIRTAPDSTLAGLAGHDDVAFGVDHHAENARIGWNVTVKGSTAEVDDPTVVEQVLSHARLHPWAPGERLVVIALTARTIAGRRVASH